MSGDGGDRSRQRFLGRQWISWDEIDEQIQHKEWRARFPNADLSVVSTFENLMSTAEHYHELTGRHLQVFGDIGELYGCITHGLELHRNYAQGSDGITACVVRCCTMMVWTGTCRIRSQLEHVSN